MLYVASLDNYLMGLKSMVRKGKAHPVITIRTQLAGASERESEDAGPATPSESP